jgi:hypothetical protein
VFTLNPKPDQFRPYTVPSPIGGLNAYDSITVMPETDALVMQNWWPQPYGCSVRKGYVQWATGMPGPVETLASWNSLTGTNKMFAWSSTGMYDVSSRAAVGAALVTGLSNAKWETVNLTNAAGNNLICVNGTDNGIRYSNSGVARITAGDGVIANTWAGLNPVNAVQLTVHQKRLWAVEKDSSRGWYLPPDAIQGTFVSFDFGPQFKLGGYLQFLSTWTLDDGDGADDHLIAVSSEGEAVVYRGSDPSNAATWTLAGVYYIGSPVSGRRAFTKAAGDQLILTQQGLVSMTGELVSTKVENANEPLTTRKIQFLISELVSAYKGLTGWQVIYHPPLNMVLIGVPSVVEGGNIQLAGNQIIKSWTQFNNMDGVCWLTNEDQLYFGDYSGNVQQAWTGYSDKVLLDNTGGEGITATVQQAYSYFGGRANQKQVGMYRPTFVIGGSVSYNTSIIYDFADKTLTTPSIVVAPLADLWNTGVWGTAFWTGGTAVQQSWVCAQGMGVAASLKMVTISNTDVLWVATDYTMVQSRGVL